MINILINNNRYSINPEHINAILPLNDGGAAIYLSSGDRFVVDDNALAEIYDALGTNYYDSLTEIENSNGYLYKIEYDSIDYNYANHYFSKNYQPVSDGPVSKFACSSFRAGKYFARNFDLTYDKKVSFVVVVPRSGNRYASIGVAGFINDLTTDTVPGGRYNKGYKIVPFNTVDGINEWGLCCNNNVVPSSDKGKTTGTNPSASITMCMTMIPRYILDNFTNAKDAVTFIRDNVNVYSPATPKFDYDQHFLVSDDNDVYIMEFVNNRCVVHDCKSVDYGGDFIMTNFHVTDVVFNEDGTVYTPATQTATENAMDTNHITGHGSGLERYNIIQDKLADLSDNPSETDIETIINSVEYSQAYTNTGENSWYTEMVGARDLTPKSTPEEYAPVMEIARQMFDERSRENGLTWQTVHSSIYDLDNLTLKIHVQEDKDHTWKFDLNGNTVTD